MSLQGKVVIVTGATKGIGRYAAKSLACEGVRVVIVGLDSARLSQLSDELRATGVEVLASRTDVRSEEEVRAMIDRVMDQFGRIDVLINNAAVVTHFAMGAPRWPRIRDMQAEFWNRVIETNLGGPFYCIRHALPRMEARRSGHIINLYGGANVKSIGSCAYVVSKEAVLALTRYLAEEEREWNVCVLALTPGKAVATEEAPEEARRRLPGVEMMGKCFVEAAQAPMEWTGKLLVPGDGALEIVR
ncbi:MAG: SDR family NAD(P)-dependent oxidoreductase [Deltaproteobacteria bacterium]|nr:SDR family NAD(P)-dependent oxidoreductase [Deltaproteobacteria bacterium]